MVLSAGAILSVPHVAADAGQPKAAPQALPSGSESAKDAAKEFVEGIRIDWKRRAVEVDSRVVLREGPLELLACSPMTREHESILVVPARPRDIYHAMGLMGLEPGSPPRYDMEKQRAIPATGESLRIMIQCDASGHRDPVPAARWLLDKNTDKPLDDIDWVFAGSRSSPEGRFLADLEGTVICVVDFDMALISPASSHTSDNEALWLSTNTDAIPPIGTNCVISIESRDRRAEVEIELDPGGGLSAGGKPASLDDIARGIVQSVERGENVRITMVAPSAMRSKADGELSSDVKRVVDGLVDRGIRREWIRVRYRDGN
ncbi:MAG: hypothetical protein J5J06_17110 [Phycisphaerae bacterium]|nr:hypothetical protein [Phycisphaerae bacterium]